MPKATRESKQKTTPKKAKDRSENGPVAQSAPAVTEVRVRPLTPVVHLYFSNGHRNLAGSSRYLMEVDGVEVEVEATAALNSPHNRYDWSDKVFIGTTHPGKLLGRDMAPGSMFGRSPNQASGRL